MLVDRWTIGQRLYGGLTAFLALIVLAGGVATWSSSRIKDDVDTIAQRATELQRALAIQTALFKIESSEKTLLWAGLDNDRPLYDASKAAVATEYEGMSKLVAALEAALAVQADLMAVRTIRQNLTEWKTIHMQVVTLSDSGSFAAAQQILTLTATPLLKAAEEAAQSIVGRHEAAMAEANVEAAASYRYSQFFTGLVIVLALLVGGLGAWLARALNTSLRNVSRELAEGAELVVDTSSQMSVSAESMAQGASEQAASLEETSASMEEMASMTRRNADDSLQAATLMGEAARVVDSSNDILTGMVTSMTSIKDSSKRVSKIIKTIDEIAFQTNILALNAAVEAARAGEAGMGFAVVADEVRNLAQRSAQAAKDTAGLIEEAITSSSEGSEKVEQVAGAFRAITQRVTEVKSLVDNVSVASKQQALGIEQVSQSIRQMEKVTQTTAATAEESAAACEQLNAQADITMRLVERLEGMVGRNVREPRTPAPQVRAGRGRRSKVSPLLPLAGAAAARHRASDEDVALAESGTFGRF